MTDPDSAVISWCQSGWLLAAIVPTAAGAGHFLVRWVDRLTTEGEPSARPGRLAALAAVAAAVALWWWEIRGLGQLPADAAAAGTGTVCLRFVAHLILFALLAVAAVVDLRQRVIPDSITVPGVLGGLAWNAAFPATLLPIGHAVDRSFAPPQIVADALAAWGSLQHATLPGWLSGPAGLAAAAAAFTAWWAFGLPAADGEAGRHDRDLRILRGAVAAAGTVGIVAARWMGGGHWAGLVTALTGMVLAGGVVWATRIGASRALGREALGFGDVTLMAMAGAWLGWQACLLACGLGVFIGLAHGILQIVRHSDSELPFGPSLCLGLVLTVVCWRPLWSAAAPQFERPLELAAVVGAVIVMTAATLWAWSRLRRGSPA